jgi:hypothetical protein
MAKNSNGNKVMQNTTITVNKSNNQASHHQQKKSQPTQNRK